MPTARSESSGFIPKVLITKIGFDGHDRGSRLVAAALRDAGMEVSAGPTASRARKLSAPRDDGLA